MVLEVNKLNRLNIEKYKMVVRYIIFIAPDIGKTQLNKLLFFVDKYFFSKYRKTLTTDSYIINRYGPTPKSVGKILSILKSSGEIDIRKDFEKYSFTLKNDVYNEDLNKILTASELGVIHHVYSEHKNLNASTLSNLTHNSIYHSLNVGDELPNFILPYYEDEAMTPEEIKRVKERLSV